MNLFDTKEFTIEESLGVKTIAFAISYTKPEEWVNVSKEELEAVKLPDPFEELKKENSFYYHGKKILSKMLTMNFSQGVRTHITYTLDKIISLQM